MDIFRIQNKQSAYQTLFLFCAAGVALTLARTIASAIFITHYPTAWLPYFYLGQSILSGVIVLTSIPLFIKGSRTPILIVQGLMILSSITLPWLIQLPWQWSIFIASLGILTIADFFNIIGWYVAGQAFSVQDFKQISTTLLAGSTICVTTISFTLATLGKNISIDGLIVGFIICLIITSGIGFILKYIEHPQRKASPVGAMLSYPLYRHIFIYVFVTYIALTVADYTLKYQLAITFEKEQITTFLLYFFSATAILRLMFLLICRQASSFLTVSTLLLILPMVYIVSGIALMINTNLWTITIFASAYAIFGDGPSTIGREIALNALPKVVSNRGRLFVRAFAIPAGILMGMVFLWLFRESPNFTYIAIFILGLMAILLFEIRGVWLSYLKTLKLAIALKRFDITEDKNSPTKQFYYHSILQQLHSDNDRTILFCFYLLQYFKLKKVPDEALHHIHSTSSDVRAEVVNLILETHDTQHAALLLKILQQETDPKVLKVALHAAAEFNVEDTSVLIHKFLYDENPALKAGAIHLAIHCGNIEEIKTALEALLVMLKHDDTLQRQEAARLLGDIPTGVFTQELDTLIHDKHAYVGIAAVKASSEKHDKFLIPTLIESLGCSHIAGYCSLALIQYGSAILPQLKTAMQSASLLSAPRLIKIITSIESEEAETILEQSIERESVFHLNVLADASARRACRQSISSHYKHFVIKNIYQECQYINKIRCLILQTLPAYFIQELQCRKRRAKQRLVNWTAVISQDPLTTLEVMPFICPPSDLSVQESYNVHAIEILAGYLPTHALKNAVEACLKPQTHKNFIDAHVHIKELMDPWLNKVWAYYSTKTVSKENILQENDMILMEKAFTLRQTQLFKALPGEILFSIAEQAESHETFKDEVIFQQGDRGNSLYIINTGAVAIVRDDVTITTLTSGQLFGELALIDSAPRTAAAIVREEGVLLRIDKQTFEDITYSFPEVLWELSSIVLQYLRSEIDNTKHETVDIGSEQLA